MFKINANIPDELNRAIKLAVRKPFTKAEFVQAAIEHFLTLISDDQRRLILNKIKRDKLERLLKRE